MNIILQAKIWGKAVNLSLLNCEGDPFMEIFIWCHVFLQFLKLLKYIYIKYHVTLKIRKANCDSRCGYRKADQESSHPSTNSQELLTAFWDADCKRALVWGCAWEQPVWPPMKLTVKHDCWSVPQVSRPTLDGRVYMWPLPITRGFSSLLQGT